MSNNPYHVTSPPRFGQRFTPSAGVLGVIVMKLPAPPPAPPQLLPRLRDELRHAGNPRPPDAGVITWSAAEVELRGDGQCLPVGIDGEPATLQLPVTCQVRPAALRVLLPRSPNTEAFGRA